VPPDVCHAMVIKRKNAIFRLDADGIVYLTVG
jgi:hypothetical protein